MSSLPCPFARYALARREYFDAFAAVKKAIQEDSVIVGGTADKANGALALIIQTVAECSNVSVSEILGPDRYRELVEARWIAIYLACEIGKLSCTQAASRFDREHGAIIHAYKGVKERLAIDADYAARVDAIRAQIIPLL